MITKSRFITVLLSIIMIFSLTGLASAQNYENNIKSYIKSENPKVVMKFDLRNVKNTFPELEPSVDAALELNPDDRGASYYNEMKEYGIDLVSMTNSLYITMEDLPVDSNFNSNPNYTYNTNMMITLLGNYPVTPFRDFLTGKGFTESGNNSEKSFTKKSENVTITILAEKVLMITFVNSTDYMVDMVKNNKNHNSGFLSPYVKEAERKFNLMFFIFDFRELGPIDMRSFREEAGGVISKFKNLPDEITIKSMINGFYSNTNNDGMVFETQIETDKADSSKVLSEGLNQAFIMLKMIAPAMIGTLSTEEDLSYKFINHLNDNEFYDAYDMLNADMTANMSFRQLRRLWDKQIEDEFGEFKEIVKIEKIQDETINEGDDDAEEEKPVSVLMICRSEVDKYFYITITFDNDDMISNINIEPYEGEYEKDGIDFSDPPAFTKDEHKTISNFLYSLKASNEGVTLIINMTFTKKLMEVFTSLFAKYSID